jgi:gamma-glutamyltranspeptidase/glutathione hydrolase
MNLIININKEKQNQFKRLLIFICFFIFTATLDIASKDYQPIGIVNPSNYIPAQKQIAESENGMITTQHFIATKVGENSS